MSHSAQEQETLKWFVEWGNKQESVRAMVLTSSRTTDKSPTDALSDYDLILILTDIHPFFDDRSWLGDFGPVLVMYDNPLGLEDGFEQSAFITQYENGLKIDFVLWPVGLLQRTVAAPQLPEEFDAGYLVVLDKDHLTAGLKPPTYRGYIPNPPTEAEYRKRIELIYHEATYVAKFLWRDDLMAAKHIMENGMLQENLRPMLEWRSEIDLGWSVKPGPYGRRLKQWLRPDLWAELETIYTGADLQDNWDAMYRIIALFRKVAIEVGDLLGYAYPFDLDRRAMAYLHKVRNLPRDAEIFAQ